MNSLLLLVKKNIKLLLRAKASSLIVFLGPLLLVLVLGLAYNSSSRYGLNIGIYAPSFGEEVSSVISLLQEQEFRIIKYEQSSGQSEEQSAEQAIDDCVADMKAGAVHACLALPEKFQLAGNAPAEITFYVDPSRINLVWMIQETLKSKINFKAQEISQQLSSELLSVLNAAKETASREQSAVSSAKEKSSSASSSTESARGALTGLDLTFPEINYDLTVADILKQNLSTALEEGLGKVAEAHDALADLNASDTAAVEAALTGVQEKLVLAQALVSGTGEINLGKVLTLISSLQLDVVGARDKLQAAAESVGRSASNLNTASSTLGETVATLSTIESSLSNLQTTLSSLTVTDAGTIALPIVTTIKKVSKEGTYLNYSFPTLLVVVVMFTSLLLGTILVLMEKNSPAFLRNYFLPVKKATFVLSIYLTCLILVVVQIIVILGISLLFLPETWPVLLPLALILFLAASTFTFLGMALGYLLASEETAVLGAIALGSLMLFLSGAVLPLEIISPNLREVTQFNPFVLAEKIIREIFIFNASLAEVWVDGLILVAYAVVLFLLILIIESILHKNLIHRFLHHHRALRQKDIQNKNEI
ncbi:MAG: ABC transporter permease [Nanoarchaeota archaeon]